MKTWAGKIGFEQSEFMGYSFTIIMQAAVSAPVLSLSLWMTVSTVSAFGASAEIQYNRDVRPILSNNCFPCHGADSASRKAKLRLDQFNTATTASEGSPPAIAPGRPEESEVITRIFTTDEDDIMPPGKSHKVLSAQQKELLKRWITEGAEYQPHWAFMAPTLQEPPTVQKEQWVRNPIDSFVLARLEQEKLKPAPEADRRTLARRLSLDLIGLPPSSAEVRRFVNDKSDGAYERYVDELLASPHWGEHRARYWLDAARYADTHGIHFDNYREMWTYRDWVINAFNANMPFDQFTVEQLAGDLQPNPTLEQKIASGFNRCNITTSEGGAIDEEYLVLYTRDRTETTAQVWLGLTAGCAVCHDHKYDPLSQEEFYQMSAFFNNTTQKAMDGNVKDTPPIVVVPKPKDRTQWEQLPAEIYSATKRLEEREISAHGEFETWLLQPETDKRMQAAPTTDLAFQAPLSDGPGENITVQVLDDSRVVDVSTNSIWTDGVLARQAWVVSEPDVMMFEEVGDFERTNRFSYAVWVKPGETEDGALFARMEEGNGYRGWDLWFQGGKPATHIIHNWPDNALKVIGKTELPKDKWSHVCVTYDGSSSIEGLKIYLNGEEQAVDREKDKLTDSIRTEAPFTVGQRTGGAHANKAALQDVRIFHRELSDTEVNSLASIPRLNWLAGKPIDDRAKEEQEELYILWLNHWDEKYQGLQSTKGALEAQKSAIRQRGSIAHVMQERETAPQAHLLHRGNYDQPRDPLSPATPGALPPMAADLPRNRLGFAQWLLTPEHPLTARVTVNRFWQEVFGVGIVRSSGDFGIAGEMPSHPELLDWLAVDFREHGWDVKRFFKQVVMSATYRQSAIVTTRTLTRDPQNRMLSRGPRFRMDAEMVRDYALATSGLLIPRIGGPSVKPYQPEHVWDVVAMPESDTRHYMQDSGEGLYRRSIYTFWKRAAPPASMDILNAPNRETCTVRRERTNTPLQALVTLNDPQFIEAARNLAECALENEIWTDRERINFMAEQVMARPLNAKERTIVTAGLKHFLTHYRQSPADAKALTDVGESKVKASSDIPMLAAYTMVANQLMNLDEVLNK